MSGSQERKLRNRIIFRLTGRWPKSVVRERLAELPAIERAAQERVDALLKEMWR